jgi:hypothetical protein
MAQNMKTPELNGSIKKKPYQKKTRRNKNDVRLEEYEKCQYSPCLTFSSQKERSIRVKWRVLKKNVEKSPIIVENSPQKESNCKKCRSSVHQTLCEFKQKNNSPTKMRSIRNAKVRILLNGEF